MKLNQIPHKITLFATLSVAFVLNSFAVERVLFFGDTTSYGSFISSLNTPPSGDPSSSIWDITLRSDSGGATLSRTDASTYDAVVIGWLTPNSKLTGFDSALDPNTSRIFLSGQDADFHGTMGAATGRGFDGPKGFMRNAVNWAAGGSGTGYVFLNLGYTATSYSSLMTSAANTALGTIAENHTDDVRIPTAVSGYAVNQNLTTAGLTGWASSAHGKATGINSAYWTGINTVGASTTEFVTLISAFFDESVISGTGPSSADTQRSLSVLAQKLRTPFNYSLMSSNYANMNTYDCNLFDKNNMCISAGGRITTIDNPSSHHSAAVVVVGHKISPHIRIGGFLDQSVNHNMPTGVDMSNKNPMAGAFAVWNHQADGLGFQMKLANAYQNKDVTTSREVIGTSEAGRGRTDLNTQSYVGELSYAFQYQEKTLVRPYFALRYTRIKQDGYTEDTTASVTAPLTYAKLSDRSTSALMGVKVNHALTPRTNLTASLGVEQDLDHKTDQFVASGVSDLTSENFYNNIRHTRPVASVGAYYAVAKNQRLSGDIYYQQLPFQSTDSATAYVNYTIGF